MSTSIEPLGVSPKTAWHLIGCGQTKGYEYLASGELESYLVGRARRITMPSIKKLVARLVAETNGYPIPADDEQSEKEAA